MNGWMMRGAMALGLSVVVGACSGSESEPELVNPIPGTDIQLVTEDGLNHGPLVAVSLESEALSLRDGRTIELRAIGVFADEYTTDVTEYTEFAASGPVSVEGNVVTGTGEGAAEITLVLGSLQRPQYGLTVMAALNPIPGTDIQLETEDGENHGPMVSVVLENSDDLDLPIGRRLALRAIGIFADDYRTDVTAEASFEATGNINLEDSGDTVVISGTAEGAGQLTITLGALPAAEYAITVVPPALESTAISFLRTTVQRYETTDLFLVGVYSDGSQANLSPDANWTSADESVATVVNGQVTGGLEGTVMITAEYEGFTSTQEVAVECSYPEVEQLTAVALDTTFPRVSWSNAIFPGDEVTNGSLDLEDVYCGRNGYDGVQAIMFQVSAEWCQPCRNVRGFLSGRQQPFADYNVLPVFTEEQNRTGQTVVTSADAHDSIRQELPNTFGIRVGGADASPRNVMQNYVVRATNAFPTMVLVRVRDMRVVAWSGASPRTGNSQLGDFVNNLDAIFSNLDGNWADIQTGP